MNLRSAAALLLLAAAATGGCDGRGGGPYFGSTHRVDPDTAVFHVNNGSEPEYLDPGKCADGGCTALVVQLFEGLCRSHPEDGRPVQGVASSFEKSSDNRLYRFHLRPDARWSDGRPVTASDFEYAWKRVLSPKTASRVAGSLDVLQNGEDYRLGRLRVLREAVGPRAEPRESEAKGASVFPAGSVVAVVERAPGWSRVRRRSRPFDPPSAELTGWVPDALLDPGDDRLVGVRASGDLTLEVALEHPTPYFLDLTTYHAFLPVRRDVIERFAARGEEDLWTRPESIVSNGPYVIDRWAFQYEITMKDNPFYWDRAHLRLHRLSWMEVEDYHGAMNLYKAGELDWLGDSVPPPADYQPALAGKKDVVRKEALSVYWYEINTRKPPLDDVRVRWALDRAIDKRLIVERVSRGGQIPATHYVPDFTGSGYDVQAAEDRRLGVDPFAGADFDPEAARALLAEAGYRPVKEGGEWRAPGFPPIELLYNTGEGHRALAVAVQAMWKENLGVSVTLRNLEWKVLLKAHRDGEFQIIRAGQLAEYDHPNAFLAGFAGDSPLNHSGWRDAAFDGTLAQAAATGDPREGVRLYRRAERLALDAMPRIPLYFYARTTLVKPWVKGFRGNKHKPHDLQFLWIDPEWQAHAGDPDVPAFQPPELPPPAPFLGEAP